MSDSTQRFTSRVENYVRYRPRYPHGILDLLRGDCQLTSDSVVADIGSGTGFLSDLFLENGNTVLAVEPNQAMREAAEFRLNAMPSFVSVNGTAEHTTLTSSSVDFVVAGQAFHWFDQQAAYTEFKRLLKPAGWTVLVWNERTKESDPFGAAYDQFLREFAIGYNVVEQRTDLQTQLAGFFREDYTERVLPNSQTLDFEGLKGRVLSSSYAPEEDHPHYERMIAALRALFDEQQTSSRVKFLYDTNVFYGRL